LADLYVNRPNHLKKSKLKEHNPSFNYNANDHILSNLDFVKSRSIYTSYMEEVIATIIGANSPEPSGGIVEDLVTTSSSLHFASNSLTASISLDLHDGESGVDVIDGVENSGHKTTILDGIEVGGRRRSAPSVTVTVGKEWGQQHVDETTESGQNQEVQDKSDDISQSWVVSWRGKKESNAMHMD
jgi:hypothetical protein